MSHSKPLVLVALTVVVGVLTVLALNLMYNRGASLPVDGWGFALVALVACALSAWLAAHVNRLKQRKQTWMSAVGAARVAALSLALSHVGALFLGYFGGQIVFLALNLGNDALAPMLASKIAAAIGAILMIVTGQFIEKICTVDPNDNPAKGSAPAPAPA